MSNGIRLSDTKREALAIARRLGTFTMADIRQRMPGYPSQSVDRAIRSLRYAGYMDVARNGRGGQLQKNPILLTVTDKGVI